MIDSTNPRQMANNIQELNARMVSNDVEGNPTGSGFNTLLTKILIDGKKFKLPNQVTANPAGEATGELAKIEIGNTVYALGGGGGYTPNYSETEAEVGYSIGENPVYGKLVPLSASSIGTSWGICNNTLTFEYIDYLVSVKGLFKDGLGIPEHFLIEAYPDNRSNGNHKMYWRSTSSETIDTATSYLYIEYTKVTTP